MLDDHHLAKKKYTTKEQRAALELSRVPFIQGMSYDEAESLIEELVSQGTLPKDWRPASRPQLKILDELGVTYSADLTYNAASVLIGDRSPPTESQLDFLQSMGAVVLPGLSRAGASALIDEHTRLIPMSNNQADRISALNGSVIRAMSYHDAGKFIESLSAMTLVCKRCSATTPRGEKRCAGCGVYLPMPITIFPEQYGVADSREKSPKHKPTFMTRILQLFRFR